MMIELPDLEHGADRLGLALAGAFTDSNVLSMAVSFMCGLRLRSSRKLTQPIVRMMPHAQVSGLPLGNGDGRPRASVSVELAAERGIFFVQVFSAKGVGQGRTMAS